MKRLQLAAVAAVATLATVIASAVPAVAAEPEVAELTPVVIDGTIGVEVPEASVPAVDSQIGRGVALGTEPGETVPLGLSGATSALVRVSALSATADTTVRRSGRTPVVFAPAGGSASTTVLLPVHDGAVELWADVSVDVRLEVLAAFSGRVDQPGAMMPLDEPVLRAETATGLAATAVGSDEVGIGVVGAGDVPSENVRAVYLTLDVTAPAAVSLRMSGQILDLPAGRSVLTTIATPDDKGIVGVRSAGGAVALSAWVTGWVPDAPFQASQQNLPGGFDVTADPDDGGTVRLTDAAATPLDATRRVDAAYTVALLSASAATETTVLDIGRPYTGRGHGAVVDATRGALPQLTLMPASTGEENVATLRRGAATLTWAPIGDILGEETSAPAAADPTIAITSPNENAHVNLEDGGYFTLAGTIDAPEGGIDRVEVAGPDGLIGTADVFVDDDRVKWEFGAAAPTDGTYAYTATVFDRVGARASATRTVVVEAVDDEDTVVAPDVWVYNEDPQAPELRIVDDATIELTVEPRFAPGDRIVASVSPQSPEGLYAEVRSFDRIGEGLWRVTTTPASLTEAFYQVDIDNDHEYTDLGSTIIDDDVRDDPDNTPGTEYGEGDAGYQTARIVTGRDVDLAPSPCTTDVLQPGEDEGFDESATGECANVEEDAGAQPVSYATRTLPAAGSESSFDTTLGFNANVKWEWKGPQSKTPTFSDYLKSKADPEAAMNDEFREMVKGKKEGLTLALKAQVGIKSGFKLETDITWQWGFWPAKISLKTFKISVTTSLKASVGLKAFVSGAQTLSAYNTIANFSLPTVTVMAGPIPIILTNGIETAMRTESKIEAAVSGEIVVSRMDTFGYEYTAKSGWKRLDDTPKYTYTPFSPKALEAVEFKLTGQIATGPVLKAKTKLFGLAGPEIEVGAQAGIKATAVYKPWVPELYVTLALFVKLALSAKVALGDTAKSIAELIGAKFELEIVSSEWSWDIWKGKHTVVEAPKNGTTGTRGDPWSPPIAA
jgi:hypothetical protein